MRLATPTDVYSPHKLHPIDHVRLVKAKIGDRELLFSIDGSDKVYKPRPQGLGCYELTPEEYDELGEIAKGLEEAD